MKAGFAARKKISCRSNMKSCPKCNRTYSDETFAFCLDDGSLLSAPFDPEATQVMATAIDAHAPVAGIKRRIAHDRLRGSTGVLAKEVLHHSPYEIKALFEQFLS